MNCKHYETILVLTNELLIKNIMIEKQMNLKKYLETVFRMRLRNLARYPGTLTQFAAMTQRATHFYIKGRRTWNVRWF